MAIRFTSVKCPECGANLPIEEGRTQVFCSYCGTKIIITNENEYIYRHIDEAGLKQAETDRMVRMRELDLAEKNSSNRKALTIIWIAATAIMLIVSIVMMSSDSDLAITGMLLLELSIGLAIGGGILIFKIIPDKENDKITLRSGGIRFPKGLEPFGERNYEAVQSALKNAGFTNITCVNMHDLTLGLFQKPGKIEKITVGGKDITSGGRAYMADVPITITYHGR